MLVATVREVLGFGSVFGWTLPIAFEKWTIMVTPPGAFFVLAIWVWLARAWSLRRQGDATGDGGGR